MLGVAADARRRGGPALDTSHKGLRLARLCGRLRCGRTPPRGRGSGLASARFAEPEGVISGRFEDFVVRMYILQNPSLVGAVRDRRPSTVV